MNRKILNVAIPAIISNITVPLLGLVDTAITGHLGETAYLGAIALGTLFFNIIYWIFGFLRMGTSGLTAQAFGEKNETAMILILARALGTGMLIAFLLLLLQYPLTRFLFFIMDATPDVELYAGTYMLILVWGAPAMLGLYAFYGWFIGVQNSRYQMYVAISMNVVNILLSFLFVYGFGMKIEGIALSTLIAQYFGVILAWILWRKKYRSLKSHLVFKDIFRIAEMKQFFRVNSDIFLRTLCLVTVTTFFTYSGSKQGEVTLALNALMMQLFILFSYFMDGFAYAGEALSGEFTGSKNTSQLKKAIKYLFGWGIGLGIVFAGLYGFFGTNFLSILTNDSLVIEALHPYRYWLPLIPLAGFAAFVWDGIYIGTTSTRYMLYSMIAGTAAFFLIYYGFSGDTNNHVLWMAFILYLFFRSLMQTILAPKVLTIR